MPTTAVVVGILWLVPLSIVSADGIRFVFRGDVVAWSRIASIREPSPGDEEVRMELVGGRVVIVPGMGPDTAPALRAVLESRR